MIVEFNYYKRDSVTENKDWNVTWDLDTQISLDQFKIDNPHFSMFRKAAEVVPFDNNAKYKIEMINEVDKNLTHWLYLIVVDNRIIKGGKSKVKLQTRSYTAGTEYGWKHSGASGANYVMSQFFRSCLNNNVPVYFYGYRPTMLTGNFMVFGDEQDISFSTYEHYEQALNDKLYNYLGERPYGDLKGFEQRNNIS